MNGFPLHVNLYGRLCVVVGGGTVAARKVASLRPYGAQVRVVAPSVTVALREMADAGEVQWTPKPYQLSDLDGAFLVIATTNSRAVNSQAARDAQARGLLVCVADAPDEGNWIAPSVVTRGPLTLTVSTGGSSPTLAAVLRARLEDAFGPEWAILTDVVGRLRPRIQAAGDEAARGALVARLVGNADVRACALAGDLEQAAMRAEALIGTC